MENKILEKFNCKNIKISNCIDHTWRSGGYPQRRRQCWVSNELVYDTRYDVEKITYEEFTALWQHGRKIGAYNQEYNGLDGYDITYQFRL
jgi:hypothetical protein